MHMHPYFAQRGKAGRGIRDGDAAFSLLTLRFQPDRSGRKTTDWGASNDQPRNELLMHMHQYFAHACEADAARRGKALGAQLCLGRIGG